MKHYIYFIWTADSLFTQKHILFECDASGIIEADQSFEEAMGKNPAQGSIQTQWS